MRLAIAILSVMGFSLGAACADDAGNACQKVSAMGIEDFVFSPTCISVAKGTEVTFTNHGLATHTIATDAAQVDTFDSGNIAAAANFKHTFGTAGTIHLHCGIHASMKATIVVE